MNMVSPSDIQEHQAVVAFALIDFSLEGVGAFNRHCHFLDASEERGLLIIEGYREEKTRLSHVIELHVHLQAQRLLVDFHCVHIRALALASKLKLSFFTIQNYGVTKVEGMMVVVESLRGIVLNQGFLKLSIRLEDHKRTSCNYSIVHEKSLDPMLWRLYHETIEIPSLDLVYFLKLHRQRLCIFKVSVDFVGYPPSIFTS